MYLKLKSDQGETLATGSDVDGLIKDLVNKIEILKRKAKNIEAFYNPDFRAFAGEKIDEFFTRAIEEAKKNPHGRVRVQHNDTVLIVKSTANVKDLKFAWLIQQ